MRHLFVVLDTNTLVSHVWGSAHTERIVVAIAQGIVTPVLCPAIIEEFREVVGRPRLRRHIPSTIARAFISDLESFSKVIVPMQRVSVCSDPDDNVVLETGREGNADYIVSGDKALLALSPFEGIPILSPGDFVRRVLDSRQG